MKYTWAIADIHGEFDKLMAAIDNMKLNGFDLDDPEQTLVQLGDRNDRGPDSYKVNQYFIDLQAKYPGRVIVLLGNHDRMMIDAADHRSDLMYYNGGNKTEQSYSDVTKLYGRKSFGNSLKQSGHYAWLRTLPLFYETDEYFFSHAPVPKPQYRDCHEDMDFRQSEQVLTWSFVPGVEEKDWVEPNLVPVLEDGNYQGKHKLCLSGHIHGLYVGETGRGRGVIVPGVRKYGNSILLDTGSGCATEGYVSAVRLPDLLVVTSKGNTYDLLKKVEADEILRQEAERKKRAQMLGYEIPDGKVDF